MAEISKVAVDQVQETDGKDRHSEFGVSVR